MSSFLSYSHFFKVCLDIWIGAGDQFIDMKGLQLMPPPTQIHLNDVVEGKRYNSWNGLPY